MTQQSRFINTTALSISARSITGRSGHGIPRVAWLACRIFKSVLLLVASSWSMSPAHAQAPEIGGLLPAGAMRGEKAVVQIAGKNLAGAQLHISGRDVTFQAVKVNPSGDQVSAEFVVPPNARVGPREIRITTPKGASNGRRFWVDVFPNLVLEKPMTESDAPLPLDGSKPVVVNSRLPQKASRDRFTLNPQAGETWAFDCNCARIRSWMDPVLELRDESGNLIRLAQSTWEHDPQFAYKFTKSGKYLLTVRDSEFNGGPDYVYRLTAGKIPLISGYVPRGERPGRKVGLLLEGANLGSAHSAVVSIPPDSPAGNIWTDLKLGDRQAPPIELLVDRAPVSGITETDANMPLPILPADMDGSFERFPVIRFFFKGAPNEKYLFDLFGRRIGSRIDGALRVLDSSGKEVASNDDAIGKDARLEFTPAVEGSFTIEARNVEEKTGPDCYYRLSARKLGPDFQLVLDVDRLAVGAGNTTAVPVTVDRLGGFDGPIEVTANGLPNGARFRGGLVPPGKNATEITISALAEAAPSGVEIHIVGRARIGGKLIEHEARPREKYEHRSIDLDLAKEYSYTRPYHEWDLMMLAFTEKSSPVALSVSNDEITLKPGGKIELIAKTVRRMGSDGEIKLSARGLPDKVTAAFTHIAAKQNDGKITLAAAADAHAGTFDLVIEGALGNDREPAPAIRLTIAK